jgi:hypothetical protein
MRTMQIAYLTTDELNQELAKQAATACGVDLVVAPLRVDQTPGPSAVTLYDLDHLEAEHRRAVLTALLSGCSSTPTAVHSYDLQDDVAAALRACGVVICRQIGPEVIQQLCRGVGSTPKLHPDGDTHAPESDGDDVGAIGAQVRSLASAAHRAMLRPADSSSDVSPDAIAQILEQLAQLHRRIGRLQQAHNLRLEELLRWASNLQRLIEEHL